MGRNIAENAQIVVIFGNKSDNNMFLYSVDFFWNLRMFKEGYSRSHAPSDAIRLKEMFACANILIKGSILERSKANDKEKIFKASGEDETDYRSD